jgi:hypothetical protein
MYIFDYILYISMKGNSNVTADAVFVKCESQDAWAVPEPAVSAVLPEGNLAAYRPAYTGGSA